MYFMDYNNYNNDSDSSRFSEENDQLDQLTTRINKNLEKISSLQDSGLELLISVNQRHGPIHKSGVISFFFVTFSLKTLVLFIKKYINFN